MAGHQITPNSELPEEVKGFFKDNAHEKIGNTKSLLPMKNLGDLLWYMNEEMYRGGKVQSQFDAQQGINASVFWALYNLHGEITKSRKESRKEILIHRIEALQIKIEEVNKEIAKAEENGTSIGEVIHSAAKTVVDHLKGLAETMIGFATENPVLTTLGCASLGLGTTADVKELIEKLNSRSEAESEISRLKKELSKLEKNMAENKGKLRKEDSDGN